MGASKLCVTLEWPDGSTCDIVKGKREGEQALFPENRFS